MNQPITTAGFGQCRCGAVGGAGVVEPQAPLQQREYLRCGIAALAHQMTRPLAQARNDVGLRRVEEDQRLGVHPAILDAAEAEHVDARAPRHVGRVAAGEGDGIGEARTVHVEAKAAALGDLP